MLPASQIYEWCCYMEASGRVSSLNTLGIVSSIHDHPVSEGDGEPNSMLSAEQVLLLDEVYQVMIPKYKNLTSQYKAALQKAKNARRKSTFPPRSEWELQQYPAGSSERNMLVGPTSSIFLMKKIVTKDSHTHRDVTFNTAENDRP